MTATVARCSLQDWVLRLGEPDIPVMRRTVRRLARLRSAEDLASPSRIARIVLADPLMTLKVLRRIVTRRSARIVTDIETVTAAAVLMGVSPFFREFGDQPMVEDVLVEREAFRGLLRLLRRARRAALLAVGIAVQRQDGDTELIYEAAMFDDFAEMLLWCHEPRLAAAIAARQQADSTLRSSVVQRDLLGVELGAVQQALLAQWRMPAVFMQLADPEARTPRARNIRLAVRLARHLDSGWDNAAIPDDLEAVAELLNISPAAARWRIDEILS